MTAFEAYQLYIGLKNHFTKNNYDFVKYNGKVRVKLDSFNKRSDKIFFEKLAKHEDLKGFLVANLSENPSLWVKNLAYSEEAENRYKAWKKYKQSFTYNFKQDLNKLGDNYAEIFSVKNNEHPLLFKEYFAGNISIETLCLLEEFSNAFSIWDKKLEYDIVYNELKAKINKYRPFIEIDREKLKKLTIDKYFNCS